MKTILCVLAMFCVFHSLAQKRIESPTIKKPEVFQKGIISTGDFETHPCFSPTGDTLYFLKCMADGSFCTIMVSYLSGSKWTKPEVVSFSGQYNDADPYVTKDGNRIYYVTNRPHQSRGPVAPDWDIWYVQRKGNLWAEPVRLDSPFNTEANEFFPTIADNGNFYFGSGRAGGKGQADIYVSNLVNGKYDDPKNIGDSINTGDSEYEPYIDRNEHFLIYMATPNSIRNADFYISFNQNGQWSKGIKIPEPVNSSAIEWGGKLSADGKYFFFGSSRPLISDALPAKENTHDYETRLRSWGNGLGDIYSIELSGLLKLKDR